MVKKKDEPVYEKPASQVDLEARIANGNASNQVVIDSNEYRRRKESGELEDVAGRDFTVEGNDTSGYVGVDPIYQNYANETEAPMKADEGAEATVFEQAASEGDIVVAVAEEIGSDSKASRDTDETSSAAEPDVTTLQTPVSPTTPGKPS